MTTPPPSHIKISSETPLQPRHDIRSLHSLVTSANIQSYHSGFARFVRHGSVCACVPTAYCPRMRSVERQTGACDSRILSGACTVRGKTAVPPYHEGEKWQSETRGRGLIAFLLEDILTPYTALANPLAWISLFFFFFFLLSPRY